MPVLRTIVVLLVTLALLALAVVLLSPAPSVPLVGTPLLPRAMLPAVLGPGGRVEVALPTGSTYSFESGSSAIVATVVRPGKPTLVWPASPARVRAAMQLLSEAKPAPAAETATVAGGATLRLVAPRSTRLSPETMQTLDIEFDSTPLGGAVAVRVSPGTDEQARVQTVGVTIADLFTDAGLMLWLDASPFRDAHDAAGLAFVKGAAKATLKRRGAEWWISLPALGDTLIPADRAAVNDLLGRLALVTAVEIESAAEAQVADPSGLPHAGGEFTLTYGAGASASTRRLAFVMAGTRARAIAVVPGGSAMLTIDARADELFPDVASLIARTSLPRPAADALRVTISRPSAADSSTPPGASVVVSKTAGAWTTDGKELAKADAAKLEDALRVLAQSRADALRLGTPADFDPVAEIVVHDLSGSEACRVLVGRAKPPSLPGAPEAPAVLCIVSRASADHHDATRSVTRFHAGKSVPPLIEWLSAQLP